MRCIYLKNISAYQPRNRHTKYGGDQYHPDKTQRERYILLFIQQLRNGIPGIEVEIDSDKYQIAKLDGNGMGEYQSAVPENKYPAKVGQQPKSKVIYELKTSQTVVFQWRDILQLLDQGSDYFCSSPSGKAWPL